MVEMISSIIAFKKGVVFLISSFLLSIFLNQIIKEKEKKEKGRRILFAFVVDCNVNYVETRELYRRLWKMTNEIDRKWKK